MGGRRWREGRGVVGYGYSTHDTLGQRYSYPKLLNHVQDAGWSVQNIVCGSGGGLLQKVNRDTLRFAIKANFAIVDGEERAVQKLTATKKSKAGRLTVEFKDDKYVTHENGSGSAETNLLELVFKDGKRLRLEKFDEIRNKVDAALAKRAKGVQPAA